MLSSIKTCFLLYHTFNFMVNWNDMSESVSINTKTASEENYILKTFINKKFNYRKLDKTLDEF